MNNPAWRKSIKSRASNRHSAKTARLRRPIPVQSPTAPRVGIDARIRSRPPRLQPLARIIAHQSHAQDPAWFTTAPVDAIAKLLAKINWRADAVDLYEINEAFAVVTMAAMVEHKLAHDKVNIHGGACALGHPVGASGARLMATLLYALRRTGGKRGIASLCIGGGEAVAMAVEMV